MSRRRGDLEATAQTPAVRASDNGDSAGRLERLGDAVSRIRGGRRMDPERMQLIAGAVLAVLGIALILMGWYGAANTGFAFEQTPYLISGGLLGVALVFLGGFVYFAYWVTRLVQESRTQSERASELLDRIAETLDGAAVRNGGRSTRESADAFVATSSGTLFHRPDCAVVAGKRGLKKVSARTRGLQPCKICEPLAEYQP